MKTLAIAAACIAALSASAAESPGLRDYADDAAFVRKYRAGALEIARRKMAECEEYRLKNADKMPKGLGHRIATGGHFGGIFLWDSAFCVLWARHTTKAEDFPIEQTLDNFYVLQDLTKDGFICREFSSDGRPCWLGGHPIAFNPPLLTWAEMEVYQTGRTDKARLARVYPHLVRHHAACRKYYRRDDGLYFGDILGSGMDELPRWPRELSRNDRATGGIQLTEKCVGKSVRGFFKHLKKTDRALDSCWNRQAGWIDMSAQMALDARELAAMADELGKAEDAASYRAEYEEIKAAVNRFCWDEKLGFYCDVTGGKTIPRRHAGAFWVLMAGLATPERAKAMRDVMMDPKLFFRNCPFPALPADDPDYRPDKGYWCGVTWPPTNYVAIRGLRAYGFEADAEMAARRWYNACARVFEESGTCRENLNPDTARARERDNLCGKDFCGWAALAPVAIPAEFGWLKAQTSP